jgi:hypothetical protein
MRYLVRLTFALALVAFPGIAVPAMATTKTAAVAGDIAKDPDSSSTYGVQSDTAQLVIDFAPDKVFTVGDTQYADGDELDYLCSGGATSGCGSYADNEGTGGAAWGDFLSDTIEAVGNHEYYDDANPGTNTCCDDAEGFRNYFSRQTSDTDPIVYTTSINTGAMGHPEDDTRVYVIDSMDCERTHSHCQDNGAQYEELQTLIGGQTETD